METIIENGKFNIFCNAWMKENEIRSINYYILGIQKLCVLCSFKGTLCVRGLMKAITPYNEKSIFKGQRNHWKWG